MKEQTTPQNQPAPAGQASPAGQDNGTLALILTDVKKLIRHFKLDRHSKNNPDDPAATETPDNHGEQEGKMLREILERIDAMAKTIDRKSFTPEQEAALKRIENTVDKALRNFHNVEYRELKAAIDRIEKAVESLKAEKHDSAVTHLHRHSIDAVSSKNFIANIVVIAIIGVLIYVVGEQHRRLDRFRDNDLKYRYIQMRNGATPEDIIEIREVFEFHRAPEVIEALRRRVEEYEQLIRQEAENAAKARLNAAEAERLKNAAEAVKGGAAKGETKQGEAAKGKN